EVDPEVHGGGETAPVGGRSQAAVPSAPEAAGGRAGSALARRPTMRPGRVRSTSTWSGMTRGHVEAVRHITLRPILRDHARSYRSRFITLVHAATKSWTNFA